MNYLFFGRGVASCQIKSKRASDFFFLTHFIEVHPHESFGNDVQTSCTDEQMIKDIRMKRGAQTFILISFLFSYTHSISVDEFFIQIFSSFSQLFLFYVLF